MKTISYFFSLTKFVRIVGLQILLLIPYSVLAQSSFTVNITSVLVIAPYSAQLSAYVNNPSKVIITVQKLAGTPDINVKLFASLIGDNGIQITTTQTALSGLNQISLTSTQPTQVVNALFIRNIFDLNNVNVQGTTATDLMTNGLPAGNYQLCVHAVTADPDPFTGAQAGAPASDQLCGNSFNIAPLTADVTIQNILLIAPFTSKLSDFINNPSKVVITIHNGSTYPTFKVKLLASLKGDNGVQISTNPASLNLVPEITLQSGQPTVVLNATSIQNLFNLEGVTLQGITQNELVNGNGLPAGSYELCITPVMAVTDPATQQVAGQPLSAEKCSNSFIIAAPTVDISVQNVLLIAPFSSKLSDFTNNPSKVVITVHNNITYPQFKIKLLASLRGDNGVQISTNPASLNLVPELTLQSGQPTVVLNATSIQNLFNLEGVTLQGITQNELVNGNGLPAGTYELCITPVVSVADPATQLQAGQPLSVEKCSNSFTLAPPSVDISILNIILIPPYSNRISDFLTNPSKVVITVHNSSTFPSFKIKLLASLKGDNGIQISTNPGNLNLIPDITLQSGQPTVVLNATSLSSLFNLEGVTLKGITYNDLINGNGLPEGSYELCITPVAAVADPVTQQQAGQPLSVEKCSNLFAVNNIEPPVIINPISGTDMSVRIPQNIIFNWSIPAGVKPGIQYDFKMVEIQDSLRDVNDAMQSATDPAFFERKLTGNVMLYGPGEPRLTPGFRYAYIVTASDPNNNAVFRNGGRSEVGYFTYSLPKINSAPVPTTNNNNPPNNPNNNPLPNPVPNPPPNPNIDLSQLTGDLNCSCKTQAPSGSVDNSDLKKDSKVEVGKFEMTIVSVTITNGKASGEGKMPIPFLNISHANIRVVFSDITVARVKGTNVMLTGIVKAKRVNNISLSPKVDDPQASVNPFTVSDVMNLENYFTKNTNKLISNIQNASIDFDMPLGIDKNIGGKKLIISLVDFTFTPEQAGFSACMAYTIPDDNTIISLGAKNICFNDASSFCHDLFLFLTNDIKINALNLTLKAIAKNDSGTYVSFTKDGFRKLRVRADYEFSQNLIVSQSNNAPVIATLVADVVNWNDWMATMNIDPFYLADNHDFAFNLKGVATYDHSDIRNPVGMPTKAIESQQLTKDNFLNKTWYGFLMPELDITLPAVFKNSKTNTPITVKVENMMIDNMGLTGEVHGDNILNIDDGNLDGWAYSLDSIGLRFVNNTYTDGGLRGKVLLPITKNNVQSQLDYKCTLTHESNDVKKPLAFNFVIKPKNTIEVPVFVATVDIDNTSSIVVKVDKDFSAVATLNGKMDISTPKGGSVPEMKLLGMEFQGMVLQSKPKYFSVNKFAMSLNSPPKESSGFPISIDSVKLITDNGIGIRFAMSFTLADIKAMPKASTVFSITGNPVQMQNGKLVFDFSPKLSLEKISIEGDMSVLKVKGFIQFYNGDATYGDGFKGAIQAIFPSLSVEIDAALQIGNVNSYSYWYVDALIDFGNTGIPMFPSVAAYGFGGGAFYNMKSNYDPKKAMDLSKSGSADVNFGQAPSGLTYVPEQGTMGIKASVIFGLQQRETFNANVSMILVFNSNGGIESFTLTGDARVISKNKDTYLGKGSLLVNYQFDKQLFDLGIQLELKIGTVTGNGTLALHAEPAGFYLKVGRAWPVSSRVNINFGPLAANFYFQAGTMDLDPIPPIPNEIQQILTKSGISTDFLANARSGLDSDGSGLIFGGGLSFNAGGCFLIICGKVYAGIGFDASLQKYATDCNGNHTSTSQIGIDGWYVVGQAYAGVQATLYIDLGITKATIFDAGAGAVLIAKLPNPEYFAGAVGGYYDIGIASGNFSYEFEYGTNCRPGANPLSQLTLIADTDPHDGDKDVEINLSPQIGTNIEIGKYFTLDEDFGKEVRKRSFRFTKDNIAVTVKMGDDIVPFEKNVSEDNKTLYVYPSGYLKTQTDYTMTITASLDEYINGWNPALKTDGKKFEEDYTIHFKTGNGIKELKLEDVRYTMPYQGERNFCYAKVAQGLINCWRPPDFDIFDIAHKDEKDSYDISYLVRFVPAGSSPSSAKITEVPVTYSGNDFLFDIPVDLLKETIYAVQFIGQWKLKNSKGMMVSKASSSQGKGLISPAVLINSGNQLFENKHINQRRLSLQPFQQKLFEFYFRTSKYSDYVEKMKTLEVLAGDFKAQGERDKYARTVNVGEKELGNPDKLKDLLSGSYMRHGNIINAYPISFCVYGDEQYDVYDVTGSAIVNIKAGQTYNVQPLLDFKTTCFEDWAKSIYESLASTIRAGGLNDLPLNTKGVQIFTDYNAAAMPPLTYNEMLTGINTSIATAPAIECGSGSTDPFVAQASFTGFSGLSNNTVSVISKSLNHSVSYGGFQSVTPSYSPQTVSLAPDPVAQKWYTSKSLSLNVSFSYGSLMNSGGNNNNSVVASNAVISNLYGNSLNAGGNKQASFSSFYQNMGNAYDKVASIQPVYVKDPCFRTNFNGIKRPGAQTGNDSMNILFGK
jgi:TANFOR domain-containing protein